MKQIIKYFLILVSLSFFIVIGGGELCNAKLR